MARTIVTPIQKRFSDIDLFLHVNNVAQQMYFDVGKTDYFAQVMSDECLTGDLRVVNVSTRSDYMSQIRFTDEVRCTTTCEKVGNKSMTLHQQLWVGDRLCSDSHTVMAMFDFVQQKSVPMPDKWRERFLAE